jgi:ribosome maturation factor RimP
LFLEQGKHGVAARVEELQQLLAPVIEALGYELWGVEVISRPRHSLVRIFIDSANGITVDHCAEVSRHASGALDVADPINGAYTLEVSSPGWDRPLFSLEQYRRFLGERVKIRLAHLIDGQRNVNGALVDADAQGVEVEIAEGRRVRVPFGAIRRANLVVESA